ncbi:DNA polymerase II [Pleionea sediminis]|uniref:DNA polymerase II n=1 Tax=Pleionea sediminis TaxID=2569479 RepID=UPI001185E27D|nr:DNA polymerase II [Pleionea sediminis]
MTSSNRGFLLSRHWQDIPGQGLELRFWVKTDTDIALIKYPQQKAVFFIEEVFLAQAIKLLSQVNKNNDFFYRLLNLKSFSDQKIYGFYFKTQHHLYQARRLLNEHAIYPLESDIQPFDRFLMERFITGGVAFTGKCDKQNELSIFVNPHIKPSNFSPSFIVASIDIETSMYDGRLFSIGIALYSSHDHNNIEKHVFMVGNKKEQHSLPYLKFFNDERDLLNHFILYIQDKDPDIFIGWNVINFDFKFLDNKAKELGIPFSIGRNRTSPIWRQSFDNSEHYTMKLEGRLVLDGIDTLRSATYHFESFSLNFVAGELLKEQKLITGSDRGQEIIDLYENDKVALAKYNLQDCLLVIKIFHEASLIPFSVQRAQLTGLQMDRFGGSVASFDNRYLPRLHRTGYIAPNIPQHPENIGSPGGYVMDSFPGIYNHVLVLDFKSLYPSIIRTFKVDPMALIEGLKIEDHPAIKNQLETEIEDRDRLVPGFNGAVFHKENNILPDLISELWCARDEAKALDNQPMSQAIKILMNSFYGVLGTSGCRFFDFRLPSSITLRGHQILYQTKKVLEEKGLKVIYGDTDSVFVWLKGYHKNIAEQTIHNIGKEIADELNLYWKEYLIKTYQLKSYLEIEFETHFKRFVMPTIRGSEKGSKKRYAGVKLLRSGEEKLIFKGLESVRTDWTLAARQFQIELYKKVFNDEPFQDFIVDYVQKIMQRELDKQLIYRKRLRRQLNEYQKNVPPHVQAAKLAERILETKGEPTRYRRGSWIEYVFTTQGPEPYEFQSSPFDYERYINRQIKPIADGILHFIGEDFEKIITHQLVLF